MLRLDPLVDRAEYNALLHLEEILGAEEISAVLPELRASHDPAVVDFALRIENLGLTSWDIWAEHRRAATEIIDSRPAATVLDLGGFSTKEEPLMVALSVLDDLWSRRNERRPVLLVIDEAHNLCSPQAETALEKAIPNRIIQIAAEGRKYGLWLLLSTQRPSRVHQGIISQCDNLGLMRMSSQRDLDELADHLRFRPIGPPQPVPACSGRARRCSPAGSCRRRAPCRGVSGSPMKAGATSACRSGTRPDRVPGCPSRVD